MNNCFLDQMNNLRPKCYEIVKPFILGSALNIFLEWFHMMGHIITLPYDFDETLYLQL